VLGIKKNIKLIFLIFYDLKKYFFKKIMHHNNKGFVEFYFLI